MQGSRYTLEIVVTGGAKGQLDHIANGVSKVSQQAAGMQEALGGAGKKGKDALDSIDSGVKGLGLLALGEKFQQMAGQLEGAAMSIVGASRQMVEGIVKEASAFEDAQSSMRFAFGDNWKSVYQEVLKDSAALTFTFQETIDLATSLGRMKINPFGGTAPDQQKFLSKTGETIRALEVLQDTADAVGKGTQDLVVSLRNAMSGSWRSLQERFDIPLKKITEWKKETTKLTTEQEKYNYMVGQLGLMFGGAGKEKAQNFTKAMAQIPDLLQQIKANVGLGEGGENLKIISSAMWDFVDALKEIAQDKEVMASLQAGFKIIANVIAAAVRAGKWLVELLRDVVKAAPWLVPVAVTFGLIATALMLAAGAVIGLTAGLVAMKMLFVTMAGPFLAMLPVVLGLVLAISAAFAVVALMVKAVADTTTRELGPSISIFEKLKLIFTALTELARTYNGETAEMSVETAQSLEKAGLMGFVQGVFSLYHKLHVAWSTFSATLDDISDQLGPIIIPMIEELGLLFAEVADALGLTDAAADGAASSTESWAQAGEGLADTLATVVGWVIDLVRWGTNITRIVVEFFRLRGAIDEAHEGFITLQNVMDGVRVVGEFIKTVFGLIVEAIASIITAIMMANYYLEHKTLKGFKSIQETWDDAKARKQPKEEQYLTHEQMIERNKSRAEKQGFNYGMPAGEFGPPTADVDERRDAFMRRTKRGMPGREEAPGGVDFNAAYAATAGNLSLLAPQGPGLPQGMGPMGKGAATERTAAASEKTAATTTQQTAILQGIHSFLQSSGGLTVNMDGEKVGALIAKHGVAVGGTH
jgi:hypothetical protein